MWPHRARIVQIPVNHYSNTQDYNNNNNNSARLNKIDGAVYINQYKFPRYKFSDSNDNNDLNIFSNLTAPQLPKTPPPNKQNIIKPVKTKIINFNPFTSDTTNFDSFNRNGHEKMNDNVDSSLRILFLFCSFLNLILIFFYF